MYNMTCILLQVILYNITFDINKVVNMYFRINKTFQTFQNVFQLWYELFTSIYKYPLQISLVRPVPVTRSVCGDINKATSRR